MGVQQRKEKAPLDCGSQVTPWDELTGNRDEEGNGRYGYILFPILFHTTSVVSPKLPPAWRQRKDF